MKGLLQRGAFEAYAFGAPSRRFTIATVGIWSKKRCHLLCREIFADDGEAYDPMLAGTSDI